MRVPPDSSLTNNSSPTSSGVRTRGHRWPRRALALVTLVVIVTLTALGVVRFLQIRGLTMYKGSNLSVNFPAALPPYQFLWRADAPGRWSAEQAFASEGRVLRTSDGAEFSPVTALWVAQSADAALVIAQMAPRPADTQHLALVTLKRTGGSAGTWQGSGGNLTLGVNCPATNNYCIQQTMWTTNSATTISSEWTWSTSTGIVGLALQFSEPLAQPARGGVLAGTTYYATSRALASGGTLVVVGTGSQATVNAAADWIARNAPRHESGPPNG